MSKDPQLAGAARRRHVLGPRSPGQGPLLPTDAPRQRILTVRVPRWYRCPGNWVSRHGEVVQNLIGVSTISTRTPVSGGSAGARVRDARYVLLIVAVNAEALRQELRKDADTGWGDYGNGESDQASLPASIFCHVPTADGHCGTGLVSACQPGGYQQMGNTHQMSQSKRYGSFDGVRVTPPDVTDTTTTPRIGRDSRSRLACCAVDRFLAATMGTTVFEHAILLAIVVAGGVGVYVLVVVGADRVFAVAAHRIWEGGELQQRFAARPVPVLRSSVANGAPARQLADTPNRAARRFAAVGVVIACAAIAGLGFGGWRFRRAFTRRESSRGEAACAATSPESLERVFGKRQQLRRLLSRGLEHSMPKEALVHHLMSTDTVNLPPAAPFAQVAETMADRQIRHLLVCRENRQLVGVISDRDIRDRAGRTAADIMTRNPLTVSPQTPVTPAITLMISKGISCLPVLDAEGELRGILTTTDLMLTLQCALQVLTQVASGMSLSDGPPASRDAQIADQPPICWSEGGEPESAVGLVPPLDVGQDWLPLPTVSHP